MSSILLFIESNTQAYCTIIDQNGERIAPIVRYSFDEISELIQDHKVLIFIQSSLVNQFLTYIPSTYPTKLKQAIPFALENQIAEDIEQIHFSYMEPRPKEQLVTIMSKDILNELLNTLDEYDIKPDKIYPTFMGLPHKENYWTLMISEYEIILNIAPGRGYSFSEEELCFMLEKLFKKMSPPQNLRVFLMSPFDLKPLTTCLKKYNVSHYIDDRTSYHPLSVFAANLHGLPESNLLQSSYVSKHKLKMTKRYLFTALLLVLGTLTSISIRAGLIYKDLSEKNLSIKKHISTYQKKLYPHKQLTSAKLRIKMRQEIETLAQKQHQPLLNALKYLESTQRELGFKIETLHYQLSHLSFTLKTPNMEVVDKTIQMLAQHGLRAEQSKFQTTKTEFISELKVKLR